MALITSKHTLSILMLFWCTHFLMGQRLLRGMVSDEAGEPLVGASVQLQNGEGAVAGESGLFSLAAPEGDQSLTVSYIGYETAEVVFAENESYQAIRLKRGSFLKEIVITALGISRERKSLGYAVQELEGNRLSKNQAPNIISTLQGKLAGVQVISAAGQVGASARVVIRGNSSIFGNNQPLFVVNGVPMDNSSFSPLSLFGGVDYGNAFTDLPAGDIESVSVLKGPAAAALYGNRAGNGVILVTTKTGKDLLTEAGSKTRVSYSSSYGFNSVVRFWQFQDRFGQGSGQRFRYIDGTGTQAGNLFDGLDNSWGPAFDAGINAQDGIDNNGDGVVDEANEGAFADQHTGKNRPWQAAPNSIVKSLDAGLCFTHSLAISAGGEKLHSRFSYTNFYQKGAIPNTDLKRNAFNLSFGAELSSKITTEGNLLYVHTRSENRPPVGYAGSFAFQALWGGRQVDWQDLKDKWNTQDELGRDYNWNYNRYNNPFWELHRFLRPFGRDRLFGTYSVKWQILGWLELRARAGADLYREEHEIRRDWDRLSRGSFQEDDIFLNERNFDLLLTGKKYFNDKFSLLASLGANRMDRQVEQSSVVVEELAVPGVFNVSNAAGSIMQSDYNAEKRINSVYGTLSAGFFNWIFVDLTGRNDWSSTLPPDANAYFYPSANLSLALSDALSMGQQLDFLKLRAGWAKVGNDTDPHQLRPVYSANVPWQGIPSFTVPGVLPNAALRPEIKTSTELGFELLAFGQRFGLDAAFYDNKSTDQILPVDVSPATGFGTRIINAGAIRNRGVEVQLYGTPIRKGPLIWDARVNWALNRSKVLGLPDGVDAIVIGNNGGLLVQAREGEEYGVLYGTRPLRNKEGHLILKDGLPQADPIGNTRLGTISPRWIGGVYNEIRWKNLSLGFLVDGRFGSRFLSWTYILGRFSGALEETLEGRRTAEEIRNGYAFEGVIDNGDGTYRPNDVKVSAELWNQYFYPFAGGTFQRAILNGDFVKLREANLDWIIPQRISSKFGLNHLSLGLYGRNLLFLHTGQQHFDPEFQFTPANGDQGFEVNQYPALRTVGFRVEARL